MVRRVLYPAVSRTAMNHDVKRKAAQPWLHSPRCEDISYYTPVALEQYSSLSDYIALAL